MRSVVVSAAYVWLMGCWPSGVPLFFFQRQGLSLLRGRIAFPGLSQKDVGRQVAGAAALAVEKVNANKALLPGWVLKYKDADSGCSAEQGLSAMGELLRRDMYGGVCTGGHPPPRFSAVIGPACSSACAVTSHLAAGQSLPEISWGCTSPVLSNKDEYQLVHCMACLSFVVVEICSGCAAVLKDCSIGEQKGTPCMHAHARLHARMHACMHACTHMDACTQACTHTCTHMDTQ